MAHESRLFRLPEGITLEEGALIEPLAVAVEAVLANLPACGDRVLVIGGGVIGNLLVQTIRALGGGFQVTVSGPSSFHAHLALVSGTDRVIEDGGLFLRRVLRDLG